MKRTFKTLLVLIVAFAVIGMVGMAAADPQVSLNVSKGKIDKLNGTYPAYLNITADADLTLYGIEAHFTTVNNTVTVPSIWFGDGGNKMIRDDWDECQAYVSSNISSIVFSSMLGLHLTPNEEVTLATFLIDTKNAYNATQIYNKTNGTNIFNETPVSNAWLNFTTRIRLSINSDLDSTYVRGVNLNLSNTSANSIILNETTLNDTTTLKNVWIENKTQLNASMQDGLFIVISDLGQQINQTGNAGEPFSFNLSFKSNDYERIAIIEEKNATDLINASIPYAVALVGNTASVQLNPASLTAYLNDSDGNRLDSVDLAFTFAKKRNLTGIDLFNLTKRSFAIEDINANHDFSVIIPKIELLNHNRVENTSEINRTVGPIAGFARPITPINIYNENTEYKFKFYYITNESIKNLSIADNITAEGNWKFIYNNSVEVTEFNRSGLYYVNVSFYTSNNPHYYGFNKTGHELVGIEWMPIRNFTFEVTSDYMYGELETYEMVNDRYNASLRFNATTPIRYYVNYTKPYIVENVTDLKYGDFKGVPIFEHYQQSGRLKFLDVFNESDYVNGNGTALSTFRPNFRNGTDTNFTVVNDTDIIFNGDVYGINYTNATGVNFFVNTSVFIFEGYQLGDANLDYNISSIDVNYLTKYSGNLTHFDIEANKLGKLYGNIYGNYGVPSITDAKYVAEFIAGKLDADYELALNLSQPHGDMYYNCTYFDGTERWPYVMKQH